MKTSEAFKEARKRLWNGIGEYCGANKDHFICVALDHAVAVDTATVIRCQVILDNLLEQHGCLEDWLIAKEHLDPMFLSQHSVEDFPDIMRKVQVTRRAWLDHLINHYQSIGD